MSAFRDELAQTLAAEDNERVAPAFGPGRPQREVERAMMLADTAIRVWAGGAIAEIEPGGQNLLEALDALGKPEDGHQADGAARMFADSHPDDRIRGLADAAREVAQGMPAIDDLASNESNRQAFEAVARAAARCLLAAGDVHGRDWLVATADATVRDLGVLHGWVSHLEPQARQPRSAS